MEVGKMPVQAPPLPRVPDQFLHKNRLQEYTQRATLPLPVYQTHNEGSQHAPQFRATVFVDGATYWSTQTFNQRKAAEQDVARVALEGISRKIMEEGCPMIREDTVFCKSILNEFAVKMNLETPTYVTTQPEGILPVFISSLVFNARSYTGGPGRNKREAEQLAARTVILSILGNSDSRTLLSQIIKSKSKLYAALHNVNHTVVSHDINVAYGGNFANSTGNPSSARNDVGTLPACGGNLANSTGNPSSARNDVGTLPAYGGNLANSTGNSLSVTNDVGTLPATGNMPLLSITACPEALPSGQAQLEIKKPKEEVLCGVSSGSDENVAAVTNEPLASAPSGPINATSELVKESQHVHHDEAKNAVPQVGPSAVSSDAQSVAFSTSIGSKRANKNKKKNKSKKARSDEQ